MKHTRLSLAAAIATGLLSQSANAATFQAGEWTLGLGGQVNAFYNFTQCDGTDLRAATAGATTLTGQQCAGARDANNNFDDAHGVTNGLLPSSLNFSASTTQNGYDISANINVYYSSNSNTALDFSQVDARQVFLTFGNEDFGTVKMGRDFGLFAYDAIINDMSLVGVGANFSSGQPGHTTLGGLGYGYVYVDRLSQINYTTPNWGGLTLTAGIFQGLDGNANNGGTARNGGNLGFHGKANYTFEGDVNGAISASFLSQEMEIAGAGRTADVRGYDLFAKVNIDNLSLVGYYYDAEGMSTLAIGGLILPGFDGATGQEEESNGYMLQASYTMGNTRVGLNYADSEQERVTLVENDKYTLGVYHNLTKSLTLLGEITRSTSEIGGNEDEVTNFTVGGIIFF